MPNFGEIVTCKMGHHYYPAKTPECPICKRDTEVKNRWASPLMRQAEDFEDEDRTVAAVEKKIGINPVVGWLICVSGPSKGLDYRIHMENNYIGRDKSMDICIREDECISQMHHSVITFDDREGVFYYSPKNNKNVDKVNGNIVLNTVVLNAGDIIEIGTVKLYFAPLYGTGFAWENWDE